MCSPQVNDKLTGELPLFCPLERCSHYQKPDNTIKKDGIYRTQSDPVPRQLKKIFRRKLKTRPIVNGLILP
jgi:hypothetical protein